MKVFFKIHAYLGTVCALPFLIIASTGILLGFYDQLRYSAPPYSLTTPVDHGLAPATLVEKIRTAYPEYRLTQLFLSTAPERAARARLEGPHNNSQMVFVHPGTGAVLALQKTTHQDWLSFIHALHHGKPFGLPGQIIVSVSGISLPILWIVGLVLWWQHPSRAYVWRGKPWRIRLRSVHRWLGLALGGLVAILAVLGALLNFVGPIKQWLDPLPQIRTVEMSQRPLNLERALTRGSAAYPGVPLERIYFPIPDNPLLRLRFRDGTWVYLQGTEGEVIKIASLFSHWTNLLYPLHSGRLLGTGGPWVIVALGTILLLLGGSGVFTYWRKRA
jgi:uncharacterized iron-regulated membrane protein